jgi:hypothetical protein
MFSCISRLTFCLALITICWSATSTATQTNNKPLTGYNAIIVEKARVEKNPKLAKFPAGYDTDLQQKIVADLQKKGVFAEVIDAGVKPSDEALVVDTNSPNNKRLLLSTKIIDFSPGNKALRYTVGWGAGATKVKAKFVFTDAATGREIFNTTLQGKFLGFVTIHGTGKDYGITEASGDIVDGLIRVINKNR